MANVVVNFNCDAYLTFGTFRFYCGLQHDHEGKHVLIMEWTEDSNEQH